MSLLNISKTVKSRSKNNLNTLASMEANRNMTNASIDAQKESNQKSGAASGAMIATMMGAGPWGIALGAGLGLLGGSL